MQKKMKICTAEFLLMKKMSNFCFFENYLKISLTDFPNILSTGETFFYCGLYGKFSSRLGSKSRFAIFFCDFLREQNRACVQLKYALK